MKALLWKDYRQNRRMLIAVGIFVVIPYVVLSVGLLGRLLGTSSEVASDQLESWGELLWMASMWSLCLSMVAGAFVAGNAIAGERADRSAEFAAYLPISRWSAIAGKAMLAVGLYLSVWIVNLLIGSLAGDELPAALYRRGDSFVGVMAVTAVLIFGVSWLLSCLLSSSAIAAAGGLAAPMIIGGGLTFSDYVRGLEEHVPEPWLHWYVPLCLVLGVTCFVGGVVYYLRRVEP